MDGVAAVAFAVPEMGMMGDMQGWPELPSAAPRTRRAPPASATRRPASSRTGRPRRAGGGRLRRVKLKGVTQLDPKSPAARNLAAALKIDTDAEISTIDGWVVRLKQVQTRLSGPQKELKTTTIAREDPPACPTSD